MASNIEFYFDFASPYGYLAATQIDEIGAKYGRNVDWRPILLGAVFKITGNRPLDNQMRSSYMRHDIRRFARFLDVPITFPESFPVNSVATSRAFYWLDAQSPEKARQLARAIYHYHWGEGGDPAQEDAMRAIAERLHIDSDALIAGMQDQAVKDRLKAETDRAIEREVFGAPTIIVDGEAFWGADRLDQVEWALEGGAAAA